MDEIIVRPKYPRHTGTPKKRKRENDQELMSTLFAAKLLVAVVILSILALCKAANTPLTNAVLTKVKVVTTLNYDTNKYISGAVDAFGINIPGKADAVEASGDAKEQESAATDTVGQQGTVNSSENAEAENSSVAAETTADSSVAVMNDFEIKEIAAKYAFITPVAGEISSPFGTRTDPLSGASQFHRGIDIEANMGTSIKASLAGEVIEAGSTPEYDNYIKIKHNDNIVTVYAHCSILIAEVGEKVKQGDVIAKVGDTEGLGGAYLHFEVWKDNKAVNPDKLLNYLNQAT